VRSKQWYRDHPEVANVKNARRRAVKANATPNWLNEKQRERIAEFYREAHRLYLVGAINVLRAGHARLACEVNGDVSRQQQEPSERAA
jgi:hypothetical protein